MVVTGDCVRDSTARMNWKCIANSDLAIGSSKEEAGLKFVFSSLSVFARRHGCIVNVATLTRVTSTRHGSGSHACRVSSDTRNSWRPRPPNWCRILKKSREIGGGGGGGGEFGNLCPGSNLFSRVPQLDPFPVSSCEFLCFF